MKSNILKTVLGALVALVMVNACSPASPKLKPMPVETHEEVDVVGNSIDLKPMVDILFVVDSSGSMHSHQQNLSANIDAFINQFSKIKVDYHLGVITTDDRDYGWGGTVKYKHGELVGKSVKIITPLTPGGSQFMKENILVGTDGSATEQVFDPLIMALSPEKSAPGKPNYGFLRPNAHLVVFFITDAEDQSRKYTAQTAYDYLVRLKGTPSKVISYGVIVPSSESYGCARDSGDRPVKIENFLSRTINAQKLPNVMSLCDAQFGSKLMSFSNDIIKYLTGTIYLDQLPLVETIRVFFGNIEIPSDVRRGWYYDPAQNAIVLGEHIELDIDSVDAGALRVVFKAVNGPDQN